MEKMVLKNTHESSYCVCVCVSGRGGRPGQWVESTFLWVLPHRSRYFPERKPSGATGLHVELVAFITDSLGHHGPVLLVERWSGTVRLGFWKMN